MDLQDALFMALLFLVFGTLAVGITARLAIRPIVEAIVRLRESFPAPSASALSARRLAELEAEVSSLRQAVTQLTEEAAFDRQIQNPGQEIAETRNSGGRALSA